MADNVLNTVVHDDATGQYTESTTASGGTLRSKQVIPKSPDFAEQTTDYTQQVELNYGGLFTKVTDFYGNTYENTIIEFDPQGKPVTLPDDVFVFNAKVKQYGDGSYWRQAGITNDIDGYTTLSGLVSVVASTNPIVNGDVIATVPPILAPNLAETFIVTSNIGPVRIDVLPTGEIKYVGTANITQYVSFSGIRYVTLQ